MPMSADPTGGPYPEITPGMVLDFWFGVAAGWPSKEISGRWFMGGPEFDQEIRSNFGTQVAHALRGGFADWPDSDEAGLARVLMLDQFTRNLYRGTAHAYSGDRRALADSRVVIAGGALTRLPAWQAVFLLLPLEHTEDLETQDRCVSYFEQRLRNVGEEHRSAMEGFLSHARDHRAIIRRFGRFPHRNQVLNRASTCAELEFLTRASSFGQ